VNFGTIVTPHILQVLTSPLYFTSALVRARLHTSHYDRDSASPRKAALAATCQLSFLPQASAPALMSENHGCFAAARWWQREKKLAIGGPEIEPTSPKMSRQGRLPKPETTKSRPERIRRGWRVQRDRDSQSRGRGNNNGMSADRCIIPRWMISWR
jgi:hypothetical protein